MDLIYRKATLADLKRIVQLLQEDDLGATRECLTEMLDSRYMARRYGTRDNYADAQIISKFALT